ncbi:MAG: DUF2953 domain-containing protein [Eubacteriales bacterium]|nr:DUF2953 domain-containing protein [Eubacteriales bacterium]
MIALWILGILLALILLLLFLRVGVHIAFGDVLKMDAFAGPFKIAILPKKTKPKKKEKPKKEKKKEPAEEDKPKEKKKPGLTFTDVRSAIPAFFEAIKNTLHRTRMRMRIDPMRLAITFGSDDPAKTAEMYGWAGTAMWTLMPRLEELIRIPNPSIHLDVDFQASSTKVEGEMGISFQIRDFFAIGFAGAKPALKWFVAFKKAKKLREAEENTQTNQEATEV